MIIAHLLTTSKFKTAFESSTEWLDTVFVPSERTLDLIFWLLSRFLCDSSDLRDAIEIKLLMDDGIARVRGIVIDSLTSCTDDVDKTSIYEANGSFPFKRKLFIGSITMI